MFLIDNVVYLKKSFPNLWNSIKELDAESIDQNIKIEKTKSGVDTMLHVLNGKAMYIHSKYNPVEEAQKLVSKYPEIENYKYILFYGLGLGYQIEAFSSIYRDKQYLVYEPSEEVFAKFMSCRLLKDLGVKDFYNIGVQRSSNDLEGFINNFVSRIKEDVLIVTLPSYENIFSEQYSEFCIKMQNELERKKTSLRTDVAFEKRWTLNSMLNFTHTINTPNIIIDKKEVFQNKPAIIVSAGPSLDFEIESLRTIKNNGLAYIFSVGSSINALIENGIHPDAACTYDPTQLNQLVFSKVKENHISDIPLIFGTSVGYETIQDYPGPMFHMITSQDTISDYYLKGEKNETIEVIYDAPSIAVVTLQLLYRLGCSPIILVGQNLGYLKDRMYSKDIEYHSNSKLESEDYQKLLTTKDVYGNDIYTNRTFNIMRKQMEDTIEVYNRLIGYNVINTTQCGADIKGSKFMTLENVIKEVLKNHYVDTNWSRIGSGIYDQKHMLNRNDAMIEEQKKVTKTVEKVILTIKNIDSLIKHKSTRELDNVFAKLDKEFRALEKNKYYTVIIKPMNRVHYDILLREIQGIRSEKDIVNKGKRIVSVFSKYIYECKNDIEMTFPVFESLSKAIEDVKLQAHKH